MGGESGSVQRLRLSLDRAAADRVGVMRRGGGLKDAARSIGRVRRLHVRDDLLDGGKA
jgi:hypothetical protein